MSESKSEPAKPRHVAQFYQAVSQVGGVVFAASIALFVFTVGTDPRQSLIALVCAVSSSVLVMYGLIKPYF